MLDRSRRLVAATVIMVIAGLPAAALACAQVCASHTIASNDDAESCHQSEATDVDTISADAPNGCSLISLRDVGTRERVAAPLTAGDFALVSLHVRALDSPRTPPAFGPDLHSKIRGVPIGTRLPLRI